MTNYDLAADLPVLKRGVGFRRLFGEGVALVAQTSKVNILNEPACRFLELADGTRTFKQILEILQGEYEADPEAIRNDVLTFAGNAEVAGLIEIRKTPKLI